MFKNLSMIRRITLVCLLFLTSILSTLSQEVEQVVSKVVEGSHVSDMLIPLSDMQLLAVQNSPLLKFYNADIIISELKIKAEKRNWMTTLGFEASAKYGLFDNLLITEDLNTESTTSSTEQTRYSVGLTLKIPLNTVADRTNVKQAKAELEKFRFQKENSIKELRQLVIVQYNNVLKSYTSVEVRNKSLGVLKMHLSSVEKDFVNGKINIAEYSRVNDIKMNAELEFEKVKIELLTAIQILSEIVGKPVITKN
jgi:outer membrane protein TolC